MVWNKRANLRVLLGNRVANYITKLRGLKHILRLFKGAIAGKLQIISQNYVVWNYWRDNDFKAFSRLQIISQNYVVWNPVTYYFLDIKALLQIISQNYVVWNFCAGLVCGLHLLVANYITKLRGLKRKNAIIRIFFISCCKLYHKTTWFETKACLKIG